MSECICPPCKLCFQTNSAVPPPGSDCACCPSRVHTEECITQRAYGAAYSPELDEDLPPSPKTMALPASKKKV